MEKYSIYKISNTVSNRVYVGRSMKPRSRFSAHINKLRAGTHEISELQQDFDEFGEAAFSLTILHVTEDWCEAARLEKKLIAEAGNSYNRLGNPNFVHHHTIKAQVRRATRKEAA